MPCIANTGIVTSSVQEAFDSVARNLYKIMQELIFIYLSIRENPFCTKIIHLVGRSRRVNIKYRIISVTKLYSVTVLKGESMISTNSSSSWFTFITEGSTIRITITYLYTFSNFPINLSTSFLKHFLNPFIRKILQCYITQCDY